jgi:transposase
MSSAIAITRTDLSACELWAASARSSNSAAARRMLALALVLEGVDRERAAHTCGMQRQTLHRYNAHGLDGPINRKAPGVPSGLTSDQRQQLAALVQAGPDPKKDGNVRRRRVDLQKQVKERFGVEMHERTVGKHLAALGYRKLSVRPQHPKSDPQDQEAFKKSLPTR